MKDVFNKKKQHQCLLMGLPGAGKATIIDWLTNHENDNNKKTLGVNVRTVHRKEGIYYMWYNVSKRENIIKLWELSEIKSKAIIFIVDSSDREEIVNSYNELK